VCVVTIRVTDNGGLFDDQVITVNIQNLDDNEPVWVTAAAQAINENNAANAPVVTLNATDADTGDTVTYSITGGADLARFNILGGDLVLIAPTDREEVGLCDGDFVCEVVVTATDILEPTTRPSERSSSPSATLTRRPSSALPLRQRLPRIKLESSRSLQAIQTVMSSHLVCSTELNERASTSRAQFSHS
jgi:hypothetical protein